MKYFFTFFILVNLSEVFAAAGIINKIYTDRVEASALIVDKTYALKGYFFTAKFQNGNVCNLEILDIVGDLALLDLRLCSMRDYLKFKQKLGSPLKNYPDVDIAAEESKSEEYTAEKDSFWIRGIISQKEIKGVSIFLGYSFANSIHSLGLWPSQTPDVKDSAEGNINAEGAAVIGMEYLSAKENSFGWSFNGSLEFPRDFDSISAQALNFSYNGPGPNTTLWLGTLALNLNFTLPKSFIPYLGMNISLPIVSGGNLKLSSQFGLQAGLSKVFMDHWMVDLEYRFLNFRGGLELSDKVVEFTSAEFFGFFIRLKYLFN